MNQKAETLPAAYEEEGRRMALNFVTLAPRKVLMPAGCPRTQALLESAGVERLSVEIGEIVKAAGGIACLTGILRRKAGGPSRSAP